MSLSEAEAANQERAAGAAALRRILEPVKGSLALARVLAAVSGVLAIAPYVALVHLGALLFNAAATATPVDAERARVIVSVLIATFGARLALYFVALAITHFADIRLGNHIRAQMIERIGRTPLSWFTSTNSGRVRKALQDDITQVHTLIAHQPVEVFSAIVTPVALAAYAFFVDWRLGLLALATLPLYGGAMVWMMRGTGEKTVQMDARLAKVSATMVEFVTGITVVKAFGSVGRAHRHYQEAADDFARFYVDWTTPMLRGSALANATIAIPVLLLVNLGGGAAMVAAGWVAPADVLATTLIALVLPYSIEVLGTSTWSYQLAGAAALRITSTLDTPTIAVADTPSVPNSTEVVFDDVSYSYGDNVAVDGVSFTLRPGTVTALIGPSGSGKSTLATLLARFDDPDTGRITLGGADLRQLAPAVLYRHVAFVLQDPQLLRISIRDNIALGKPSATSDEVRAAAGAAQILDTIQALPDGFDTLYGPNNGLSGGQAQRIAIARALLIDAPVLILDEATAFADPESEADIQRALTELVQGRTVLVIAHRPESILGADQIIVVDRGRIVARGTHDELHDHPLYARLWQAARARARDDRLSSIARPARKDSE